MSVVVVFFHFGQANWRNVVSLGFRQRYIEDLDFALKVCMVTALVFMPADKIYKGFQEVSMIMPEEFQYFLKCFEKTYVGMPKVVPFLGKALSASVGEFLKKLSLTCRVGQWSCRRDGCR